MTWIDETACRCAGDWLGAPAMTSYVAGIRFHRPVIAGEAVEITARIIHTGARSVHTSIHVTAADEGETRVVAAGVVVAVSLDARGGARAVRRWVPESGEDHRLDLFARNRADMANLLS